MEKKKTKMRSHSQSSKEDLQRISRIDLKRGPSTSTTIINLRRNQRVISLSKPMLSNKPTATIITTIIIIQLVKLILMPRMNFAKSLLRRI